MERRDFLQSTGALIGACLTGAPVSASAAERAASSPLDPAQWVRQMDAHVADLRRRATPPILARSVSEAGLPTGYVPDALASLTLFASFRDLPTETQADHAVQRRIRKEAHRAGKQMIRMARYLRGLGRERRRALRGQLQADPHLLDWFVAGVRSAAGSDAEPEHVERLAGSVDDLVWRLRHQGPDAVIDDVVDRVTRVSEAQGMDPHEWDDVVADTEEYDGVETEMRTGAGIGVPSSARHKKTMQVGLVLMGLGLVFLVAGAAVSAAGSFVGVIMITIAVILLLVGLILLAVAGFSDAGHVVRSNAPYESTISGQLVQLLFDPDGRVIGTWGSDARREGLWDLAGPSLTFTLQGEGETWSFEGSAHGDILAVSWWSGDRHGGARFGIGSAA